MRAAYIERPGPAADIRFGDLPAPHPGPTDVLVDVIATTVNPVDTFVRSGAYRTPLPLPLVVGRDLVGRVAEVGPGAAGFHAGDLVWCNSLGYDGRQGSAAEQAVVPVVPLPLSAVADAHRMLEEGELRGRRVVIHP
ncbi:alcohol dehydrogenase catalytic domain-containing protein [Micromonospora sp. NPDC023737]|uniref:alcohol dehydrogenase catalytic domain-containing protein n=1 Tax=unclassified Micromonospora TaxID=2617518 RepID=UPI0033FEF34B